MTDSVIVRHRLAYQMIHQPRLTNPADMVRWLGAVQAQDFLAAKWALGLRLPGSTEADIEQCIANRSVVRTWAMRGTLHLIAADDVRWILDLLRPRLHQISNGYLRRHDLSATDVAKSYDALNRVLEGGQQLTRPELKVALEQAGIRIYDIRMNLLLNRAAFDGLIGCGVRRGSENTYALLDEWIPSTRPMERIEALAELTKRYFRGHGPATLQDFVWWSGLTITEAKAGIHAVKSQLAQETIHGQLYWMDPSGFYMHDASLAIHLLPAFDEYLVGYKDRSAALGPLDFKQVISSANGIFYPVILIDGKVVGTWKRTVKNDTVQIQPEFFYPLTSRQHDEIIEVGHHYGHFKQLRASMVGGH
ncbi:winged helix DNA-binding domain-containing protein [Spirosoma sp. SC4-14]|uniref:winged helix DNA-binding domain-containing protein n=1 Tax=Spirosoma sp. SC4-14 TaxID=3128900 RepID=UPI0030D24EAD